MRSVDGKLPVLAKLVRLEPEMLVRIENAARALGLNHVGFIAKAAAERVTAFERENR